MLQRVARQETQEKKVVYTIRLTEGPFSCKMKNNCKELHLLSYIHSTKYFKRGIHPFHYSSLNNNFSGTLGCCESQKRSG